MLLDITGCFFLLMSSIIPLYNYTTVSLYFHLLTDMQLFPIFKDAMDILVQDTPWIYVFISRSLSRNIFTFIGIYQVLKVVISFYIPTNRVSEFQSFQVLTNIKYSSIFCFIHCFGCELVSHNSLNLQSPEE